MRASDPHEGSPSPLKAARSKRTDHLAGPWWAAITRPNLATYDRLRAGARWPVVWVGLMALAAVEALQVAYLIYGPSAVAGYSSLPVGPKLHLPQTPLLPLAAFVGSIAQFFAFVWLLALSARLYGGRGRFKAQAYLFALFWVPLMAISDIAEFIPVVGSWLGALLRLYALSLCVLALASAQHLPLGRAWAALLSIVVAGLLLGAVVLTIAYASGSLKMLG